MKILIGTNTFGSYKRQDIAVQSLLHLKSLFPDVVDLVDLQWNDEGKTFKKKYDIPVEFTMNTSSLTWVDDATKKLPLVQDMIQLLYKKKDYDYFILTNSDVIVMPNLIQYIIDNQPTCMACSRLDIEDIPSFQSILDQQVNPVRYEIAGFDTFVFQRKWYDRPEHMRAIQRGVYFIGKPLWDVILAGKMKIYGDNTPLGNGYPPFCFHIHHGLDSVTSECPEKTWVEQQMAYHQEDTLMHNIMFYHLKTNLLRRQPWGAFMKPAENEKEFEKNYFDILNLYTEKRIV